MKKLTILAFAAAALCGSAQASVIKIETASATSPFLGSAAAYLSAVDSALLDASYASQLVGSYDSISHQALFGGNSNFAFKSTIQFSLAAATSMAVRAGVDFGFGGAMFIDGVAVDFKSNDMWWSGNYSNPSQFLAGAGALAAGNHTVTIVGFEGCCDGAQQVQFQQAGGNWTSFAGTDGLNGVVPEPASIALLLTGVGLIGASRRRKTPQA
ncbi:CCXG family PEP-CTERM protein [Massilia sp. CF038]|uniref:CCXG family PEP-CTERM protein n=1 Tax=Massilia sp. CF038 TaxID=1881045 RepID=UPI00091F5F38|nr:CCXG family PEP-CTERM protein [Massilia sp. CF038]SHG75214.1 PEP-CTERM protein-sorting domain-containing protein [Massilia sp. CF038]